MLADGEKTIYRQIADLIKDGIVTGAYAEDEAIPSTNQFARIYNINPATANKGVTQLVDEDVLYKKRGMGMYVKPGAKQRLHNERRREFFDHRLTELLSEATRLSISRAEIIRALEEKKDV